MSGHMFTDTTYPVPSPSSQGIVSKQDLQ